MRRPCSPSGGYAGMFFAYLVRVAGTGAGAGAAARAAAPVEDCDGSADGVLGEALALGAVDVAAGVEALVALDVGVGVAEAPAARTSLEGAHPVRLDSTSPPASTATPTSEVAREPPAGAEVT